MGDVPIPAPPEPNLADELADAAATAIEHVKYVLTGQHGGKVRRAVLFVVTAVGIGAGLPWLALPALLILALTDQVVEI